MGSETAHEYCGIAEQLLRCPTPESCIGFLTEAFGLSHVAYHLSYKDPAGFEQPFLRTNYPMQWIGRYVVMNYLAVDPVAKAGYQTNEPTSWSKLDWSSKEASAFRADATANGIGINGLMVPVVDQRHRRGLVNYSANLDNDEWDSFLKERQFELVDCAYVLHSKAVTEAYAEDEPAPNLSPRELQCLILAARGFDGGRMAEELNLSEYTVRDYCKSAREKLGCANLAQAVHKATILRLIDTRLSD